MKYLLLLYDAIPFVPLYTYGPRGRFVEHPNLGLPEGNEVLIGFIIAIVAIPLGYLILRNTKDASSTGCFGTLLIGAGIIALLPLLAWLCSIFSFIASIGFAIFLVIIIITFVYHILNRK